MPDFSFFRHPRVSGGLAEIAGRMPAYAGMTIFVILTMTGCKTISLESDGKPAAFVHYGQVGGAQSVGMHTVLQGDTVYNISQRYNLALQDVINANGLQAPYALKNGMRLKLTSPQSYSVKAGDSVESIARMFNTSASQLTNLNKLHAPYKVAAGQSLRLPPSIKAPPPLYTSEMLAARQVAQRGAMPTRTTGAGRTPEQVYEPVMSAAAPASVEREVLSSPGPVIAEPLGAPPMPAVLSSAPSQKAVSVASTKIPPRSSSKFIWPADGPIVSGYGPKADGRSNDGVNIKAAKGSTVRAAENGVVVYSGNDLTGYGNLVLIRHADKWMTAYGHLDSVVASKGMTINRGQAIGTVGQTGSVDSPQLHFEVRRGTQALNPEAYLARQGS